MEYNTCTLITSVAFVVNGEGRLISMDEVVSLSLKGMGLMEGANMQGVKSS
jgi:hypothetical protein